MSAITDRNPPTLNMEDHFLYEGTFETDDLCRRQRMILMNLRCWALSIKEDDRDELLLTGNVPGTDALIMFGELYRLFKSITYKNDKGELMVIFIRDFML